MNISPGMAAQVWLLSCQVAARWVQSICINTSGCGHILASDLSVVAEACDSICDKRMEARMPHAERAAANKLRTAAKAALEHIQASRENNSEHLYAVPCFDANDELNLPPGSQLPGGRWQQCWTEWQTITAKLMWGVCSNNDVPTMQALLQQLTALLQQVDASLPRLAELEQAWLHYTCSGGQPAHTTQATPKKATGATAAKASQAVAVAAQAPPPAAAAGGGSAASTRSSSPGSDANSDNNGNTRRSPVRSGVVGRTGRLRQRVAAGASPPPNARGAKPPQGTQEAQEQSSHSDASSTSSSDSEEGIPAGPSAAPAGRRLTFAEAFGMRQAQHDGSDADSDAHSEEGSDSSTEAPAKAVAAPVPGKRTRNGAAVPPPNSPSGGSSSEDETQEEEEEEEEEPAPSRRSGRLMSAPPSRPRRGGRAPPRKAPRKETTSEGAQHSALLQVEETEPEPSSTHSDSSSVAVVADHAEKGTSQPGATATEGGAPSPVKGGDNPAVKSSQEDSQSGSEAEEAIEGPPKNAAVRAMRAADTPLTAAGVITGEGAHTLAGAEELFRVFDRLELTAYHPGVPMHRQRGPRSGDASRKAWSQEEVALLGEGLEDFGWGKWSAIDAAKGFRARGRNPADLRSKARQLAKAGKLDGAAIRNFPSGELV